MLNFVNRIHFYYYSSYINICYVRLSDYFNAKVLKKVDEWMKFHDFFVILQKILYHQDYGHSKNQG